MEFNDAVFKRIDELANSSGLTLSQFAVKSGMTPSTLYGIRENATRLPSLLSVKRICDGMGITVAKFFDVDYINESESE